ncbi:MAG TPA: LuxR C-terminal-related transcriptional regulator [Solirubrobacteraceae bacterium]
MKPRVLISSDAVVLLAGLAAALRNEGFVVARGTTRPESSTDRATAERVNAMVIAAANGLSPEVLESLAARRRNLAAVVLLPEVSMRIHAEALLAAGVVLLPLSATPEQIAAAVGRATDLARGSGAVAEVVVRGPNGRLTPREREVLDHAAQGATTEGIAAAIGVGTETAKSHLSSAYRKLGASNRAEAVATYLEAT